MAFIIADVGINHNGKVAIAKSLIDMAKEKGAGAIKFQKRTIDTVYTKEFLDSPRESAWGKTQRDQKEGLEFSRNDYDEIDRHCKKVGIPWFASAWDIASLQFLDKYDLRYNKIASPMLTNTELLIEVAQRLKLTFISTGMSSIEDIDEANKIFRNTNCPFTLMHCVSVYPCPDHLINLRTIPYFTMRYKCKVGYSGHEPGIIPSVMAVILGASAVERHVTLDRTMPGSDHAASLEPRGLERIVEYIQQAELSRGEQDFIVWPEEEENAAKLRWFEDEK